MQSEIRGRFLPMRIMRFAVLLLLAAFGESACGTTYLTPTRPHEAAPVSARSGQAGNPGPSMNSSGAAYATQPLPKFNSGSFAIAGVPARVIEAIPASLGPAATSPNDISEQSALAHAKDTRRYAEMAAPDMSLAGAALVKATYIDLPGTPKPASSTAIDWLFILFSPSGQLGGQDQCLYEPGATVSACSGHYAFIGVNARTGTADPYLSGVVARS